MQNHYARFALVLSINTVVMFLLTYATIAAGDHMLFNMNRFYMALVMVAPMGLLMLVVMRGMYGNARLNAALYALFLLLFLGAFLSIRMQAAVGDVQFLRSMIPHHSGAILVCENAALRDPEIVRLCGQIIRSQKEEIAQMQAILQRL